MVLAWDETSNRVVERRVTAVLPHPDDEIARVTIDGVVVTTTPDHPFYTSSGWVEAGLLRPGTHVRTPAGSGIVVVVETQAFVGTLWDLTVEGVHSFFVGGGPWLVHNCDIGTQIAEHAFAKHGDEFPFIGGFDEFALTADMVFHNAEVTRTVREGVSAYYDDGIIVIVNSRSPADSTMFAGSEWDFWNLP